VRIVVGVTLAMMLGELAVGLSSRSLALVAEAWHMGSHAGAIGLTAIAYWFARTRARHARFAFGTGKVHALAGFTNGIILAAIAIVTIAEACKRVFAPESVNLAEALPVAIVGLIVSLVCALLLQHNHADAHSDDENDHESHAGRAGGCRPRELHAIDSPTSEVRRRRGGMAIARGGMGGGRCNVSE
jgi:cation diffusion facilitator family transporter